MSSQDSHPSLSVVVPCFNEEAVIRQTHDELSQTLSTICDDYEIIYVNDGSADSTHLQLIAIAASDRRVRVINLARNFGHQAAVTAGLEHAIFPIRMSGSLSLLLFFYTSPVGARSLV